MPRHTRRYSCGHQRCHEGKRRDGGAAGSQLRGTGTVEHSALPEGAGADLCGRSAMIRASSIGMHCTCQLAVIVSRYCTPMLLWPLYKERQVPQ